MHTASSGCDADEACVLARAQAFTLATGMLTFAPGFAAAGILALLSPLFVPFLPVFAPVRFTNPEPSQHQTCTQALPPTGPCHASLAMQRRSHCMASDWYTGTALPGSRQSWLRVSV